jgi:hypothetical protein
MNINDLFDKKRSVVESQLNEVDPRNYDSDEDYYNAVNAPAKPKHRGQQSPGVNPDDEDYFREIFRKKREAAKKAEQDGEQGVAEGNPGYDKHSFIGKIRRGREADNKGWGQLGQLFAAGKDEKAAEKALRKGNRYYNMTRGDNKTAGGFPKTTVDEQGVAEGNTKPVDDAQQKQDKYASDTAAMAQGEIVNKLPRTLPTDRKDPKMGMQEQGQQKGEDYRDPPEADYGDDYQDMVKRLKQLAGAGPLKTVYDPTKRVYKNMPTATQPKTQPKK